MINPYKKIKDLENTINELVEDNEVLSADNIAYQQQLLNSEQLAVEAVEKVMGRGINWYDYKELSKDKWINYYQQIQSVLKSEAYKNEIKYFVSDLVQEIAKKADSWEEVKFLRATINGIETLQDRLESIIDPKTNEVSQDNINEPI